MISTNRQIVFDPTRFTKRSDVNLLKQSRRVFARGLRRRSCALVGVVYEACICLQFRLMDQL